MDSWLKTDETSDAESSDGEIIHFALPSPNESTAVPVVPADAVPLTTAADVAPVLTTTMVPAPTTTSTVAAAPVHVSSFDSLELTQV